MCPKLKLAIRKDDDDDDDDDDDVHLHYAGDAKSTTSKNVAITNTEPLISE
jgi:hypothetical protein